MHTIALELSEPLASNNCIQTISKSSLLAQYAKRAIVERFGQSLAGLPRI